MKIFKHSVIFLCVVFSICFVATAGMIIKQNISDVLLNDNIVSVIHDARYKKSQNISGVPLIRQKINCGYASIEMIAQYLGYDSVTEDSIYEANNKKFSDSIPAGFYEVIANQFPDYKITQYNNLKNSVMLEKIYNSLENKMPVIICFAAVNKNSEEYNKSDKSAQKWTIHYSVISGIDVANDTLTINDPYGYTDTYTLRNFLKASKFETYENMEFYYKLGFAFGIYNKNSIYIIEKIEKSE